jgi:outer membrane protein assembly factor BamB
VFNETLASVAVHENLVIAPDIIGFVHCLDARTGRRHWTHEMSPSPITDPLIVDGKIFVANLEGEVEILALSKELRVIARHELDYPIHAPPVFANGTLFIQTSGTLHAIEVKR